MSPCRLRNEEGEKAWQRRVDVWQKEQAAREKLMKEVLEERRHQIEAKRESEGGGPALQQPYFYNFLEIL